MSHDDSHNSMDGSAVARFLRGVARMDRVAGAAAETLPLLAGAIAVVAGGMLVDARFPMGPGPRLALAALLVGAALWTLTRLSLAIAPTPRGHRQRTIWRAARLAERRLGIGDSELINAVQLAGAGTPGAQAAFIRLQLRAFQRISGVSAHQVISWHRAARSLVALVAALALIVALVSVSPRLARLVGPRFVAPLADHPPFTWTDFAFSIAPDELTVGEDARIVVRTSGQLPPSLRLAVLDEHGRPLASVEMTPDPSEDHTDTRSFAAALRSVRNPIRIFAEGATGRSQSIEIAPVPRPRLLAATARVIMASDPNGTPEPLRIGAGVKNHLTTIPGTVVEIRLDCSIPPAELEVQGADGVEWRIEGDIARALIGPMGTQPISITLRAVGVEGLASHDAVAVTLEPVDIAAAPEDPRSHQDMPSPSLKNGAAPQAVEAAAASSSTQSGAEQSSGDASSSGSIAESSSSGGVRERETPESAATRGRTGSAGQGADGAVADGAVPRTGPLPGEAADGARRAGEPAHSSATRTGVGDRAASGAQPDGASLARVPEAYRDLVGRYFSIIAARERERRERDATKNN